MKQSAGKKPKKAYDYLYLLPASAIGSAKDALSYFDRMVGDAAYTLTRQGESVIYAKHIMELLSGNEDLTLRPDRKKAVEESLRRLLQLRVDNRGFLSEHGEPWLPLQERKAGFVYAAEGLPGLYVRAERGGRLLRVPLALLAAPALPTSQENLALTHALYQHLALRQRISFAGLCGELAIPFPQGTYYIERKEETIRQKIEIILKAFRASGLHVPKILIDT